jgi:hypothetical protein
MNKSIDYVAFILVPPQIIMEKEQFEANMRREHVSPVYDVEIINHPEDDYGMPIRYLKLNFNHFDSKIKSLLNHLQSNGIVAVGALNITEQECTRETTKELRKKISIISNVYSFSDIRLQTGRSLSYYNLDPRNCIIHLVPEYYAKEYWPLTVGDDEKFSLNKLCPLVNLFTFNSEGKIELTTVNKESQTSILKLHKQSFNEQRQDESKQRKRKASRDEDDDDDNEGFFTEANAKRMILEKKNGSI